MWVFSPTIRFYAAQMTSLVTGAARGLGAAVALRLAARGDAVALVDLRSAEQIVGQIRAAGGRAQSWSADISDAESLPALVTAIESALGEVDVLVNNAGLSRTDDIRELSMQRWRELLAINLDGTFAMCAAVLPGMIERRRGSIVNIASSSILTSTPGMTAYMASKAGIVGLTSGLANDLGAYGINVNAASPGMTRTPAVDDDIAAGRLPEGVLDAIVAQQAIRRPGTAEDLAGLVAFLTSAEASFITGQFLVADGGMTRH